MDQSTTLIIAIVICTTFSAIFSATETAYSCSSKIKLKNQANDGNKKAEKVLEILSNYDKFLTSILIGNNIVNIASATLGTVLFTLILGGNGPTVSTIVITITTLMFGEVAPKSVAKRMPEKFACTFTGFVKFVETILTPFSVLLSGWTWLVNKLIPIQEDDSDISDELITMVDEAEKEGDLEEHESDLISAAIEFNDLDVKDVLTPRVDVVAVDITTPTTEIESIFRLNSYSRLPIYENSIDNIVGVIHEKDFYELMYHNRGPLRKIIQPVVYTSDNQKISTLLKQLQVSKIHMAVVLDEYGGTQGIITMEDIIEELVGEIWDEHDTVKEFYQKLDDNTWLVKCDAEVDDLFERFNVDVDDEEDDDYITVSGWAIHELEHIPRKGETFDFKNLHVTVTKAAQRKVIEVKIEIKPNEEGKMEDD